MNKNMCQKVCSCGAMAARLTSNQKATGSSPVLSIYLLEFVCQHVINVCTILYIFGIALYHATFELSYLPL